MAVLGHHTIPPKFEHKLRRHKQGFGKVVFDKDENLLWSGLQRHRSCRSNEMTLLPILLAAVVSRHWDLSLVSGFVNVLVFLNKLANNF